MLESQGSQDQVDDDVKETNESWDSCLRRFQHNIYPTFKRYGFTLPEAFLVFKLNQVHNSIEPDEEQEDEPWKQK